MESAKDSNGTDLVASDTDSFSDGKEVSANENGVLLLSEKERKANENGVLLLQRGSKQTEAECSSEDTLMGSPLDN